MCQKIMLNNFKHTLSQCVKWRVKFTARFPPDHLSAGTSCPTHIFVSLPGGGYKQAAVVISTL